MEKIISVEEFYFAEEEETKYTSGSYKYKTNFEGYKIVTTEQEILIGIDSSPSCCEFFGHITSEDDLSVLVDQELLKIEIVDTALKTYKLSDSDYDTIREGSDIADAMFVNIVTPKDVVQFVVYNFHNGYYGHSVCVRSKQLNHDEVI